ncbi:MAG: PH domain-containing protein [Pseudomonadota bacterium]
MLQYVQESLTDDEEIIHVGRFHWVYSFSAMLNIVFGIIGSILFLIMAVKFEPMILGYVPPQGLNWIQQVQYVHAFVKLFAFFIMLMGVYKFAQMMVVKATTEMAVTNLRLIYKRGLVSRFVAEINIDRVEGVNVLQGFWGRILNFGRVMIRGMGVGEVILPPIEDPIKFRKAIDKARNI